MNEGLFNVGASTSVYNEHLNWPSNIYWDKPGVAYSLSFLLKKSLESALTFSLLVMQSFDSKIHKICDKFMLDSIPALLKLISIIDHLSTLIAS